MSKKLKNEEDWIISKAITYAQDYSRWPVIDDLMNLPVTDFFQLAWTQYAKILDNGKGLETILNIQKQVDSEMEEINFQLDNYPDDAYGGYETRLESCHRLLSRRQGVLKKLLTTFTVHGEIESTPDFEIMDKMKSAIILTCKGKHHPRIKDALLEYLKQKEANQSKTVQEIFEELEEEFDLKYSTFAGWVKQLNEEFESILLSEKKAL